MWIIYIYQQFAELRNLTLCLASQTSWQSKQQKAWLSDGGAEGMFD